MPPLPGEVSTRLSELEVGTMMWALLELLDV